MRSRDSLGQLVRLQSLGCVREQRAQAKLNRATTQREDLLQRLDETSKTLDTLARERDALFEKHRGVMSTSDLFQLKRRESILELRRIDLMLDLTKLRSACSDATAVMAQSRTAVTYARRKRDKLTHVVALVQRHVWADALIKEDDGMEEHHHEH